MKISKFRSTLILASATFLAATEAHAQSDLKKETVVATVGGVFTVTPASPTITQNSQSGNLCSPGACYVGSITAKGNRGWQLQVKLATTPTGFYVNYVQTTAPASAQSVNSGVQTRLNATTWLTIATSNSATAASAIGMQFNANKVSGNQGFMPTGAQVAGVLAYRVVAFP